MMTTRQHRKKTISTRAKKATPAHPRSVPGIAPESELLQEPEQPFGEGARDEIDPDLRHRMISETAYHLLAERGYAEGSEVEDWQQAEAAVDHLLLKPKSAAER
jgi:hypothetical protein